MKLLFILAYALLCECAFNWVHPDYWHNEEHTSENPFRDEIEDAKTAAKRKVKSLAQKFKPKDNARSIVEEIREDLVDPLKRSIQEAFEHLNPMFPGDVNNENEAKAQSVKLIDTTRSHLPGYTFHSFNDSYVVLIDMPGIPNDDIKVKLYKDMLSIKGNHEACILNPKEIDESENSGICLQRRVERSFRIPVDVDTEKVNVHVKEGVLVVQLPRNHNMAKELQVGNEGIFTKRAKQFANSLRGTIGL